MSIRYMLFVVALDLTDQQQTSSSKRIPKTVISLGWAMLFINISYVMVLSIFGLYLDSIGQSQTTIGFLEGFFEAASLIMKLFSGVISDIIRNRKGLMLIGYGLMVLSPPTIALSTTAFGASVGRMFNRLGNGCQSTPRDALVGDIAPKHMRGQSFGLKRSMGTIGSILGGVVGFVTMHYMGFGCKEVFALAIIPSVVSFLIIKFSVKDPFIQKDGQVQKIQRRFKFSGLHELGWDYAFIMMVAGVFYLSRPEEAFMSLHAYKNLGLPISFAPLIMIIYNIGYTLSSYPIGVLADKTNRLIFLAIGFFVLILADLVFYSAGTLSEFWIGVLLWGIQMGISMNIFTSIIVDLTPKHLHGTAFGCYYVIYAVCVLTSSTIAGRISDTIGNKYAYLLSAFIASLSLLFLVLVMKYRKISAKH